VSDPVSSLLVAFAPVWVFRLDFLIVNQAARDNRSDNTTERRNEKATAPSRFSTLCSMCPYSEIPQPETEQLVALSG